MLMVEPEDRLSAVDILDHPWVTVSLPRSQRGGGEGETNRACINGEAFFLRSSMKESIFSLCIVLLS